MTQHLEALQVDGSGWRGDQLKQTGSEPARWTRPLPAGLLLLASLAPAAAAEAATLTQTLTSTVSAQWWTLTATSEVQSVNFLCIPCTVTNTVSAYAALDVGDINFTWKNASGGTLLAGIFHPGSAAAYRQNVYTTYSTLIAATGSLEAQEGYQGSIFDTASGQASYYREGTPLLDAFEDVLEIIGDVAEIVSTLKGSPEKIKFTSRVERTGQNDYAYTNIVENLTDFDIPFEWQAAGLSGTVPAGQSLSSPTREGGRPVEISALASLLLTQSLEGFDEPFTVSDSYAMRANVLAPVPLPPAMWFLASGGAVLWVLRRRKGVSPPTMS